jgi:uncharacterized membrane protein YuzA (DUF378 family)
MFFGSLFTGGLSAYSSTVYPIIGWAVVLLIAGIFKDLIIKQQQKIKKEQALKESKSEPPLDMVA